jgi:tetratricopeptide (TPR) repeat protein
MSSLAPSPLGHTAICPVLVGRASTVDALRQIVDAAADGRDQIALLSGEAGIGKSRLLAEAKAYAVERGFLVLEGSCFPQERACPYAPLLDLLRVRFRDESPETVAAITAPFARELHPLAPELVPRPAGSQPLADPDPEYARRRLFAALAHCLTDQDACRPTLVVVEDLHWCDDGSLDFLHHLARRGVQGRLVILGTYRPEDVGAELRHWLAQLDRAHMVQELPVSPLSRDEVAEMLGVMLTGARPISADLLDTVHGLAEGNPFYVEELLRTLIGSGEIRYSDGAWDWNSRPIAEWQLPRSLHDAVQQRVARLSSGAREVLTLAAVIGRRFEFRLLQALAHVDELHLLSLLKELIAAQLVVEISQEQFEFRHALTRRAIYTELLARERAALHRTVGQAVEELYTSSLDQHVDRLARHFYEAESWDRALKYARQAADRTQRLYAPRATIEQLTRAIQAAAQLTRATDPSSQSPSSTRLATVHRERGQAYETLGDFAHARADYEDAVKLARVSGDRRTEWQALLDLGLLWSGRDYGQAGTYFERATELARALGEPALLAHSLNRVGNWQVNAEQPREALPLHREALGLFETLDDRPGIAATLDLLGMASFLCADLEGSMAYYERAVELLRELDDRVGLVSSLAMLATGAGSYQLGSLIADASDFERRMRYGEESIELARAIGWRAGEAFALVSLGSVVGPLGRYAWALELATDSLRIAEEIEHLQWMTAVHAYLGGIYQDLLATPRAIEHLERSVALARKIRSSFWIQHTTGALAAAYVQEGDLERAGAVLGSLPEVGTPVRSLGERWMSFGHGHLALARGEAELALRLLTQVNAPPIDGSGPRDTPRPMTGRAQALAALGRYAEAEAMLRTVQDVARRQGARPLLWRSQVGLGNVYTAQARTEEAQREFLAARALIEELASDVPDPALRDNFLRKATARLPRQYRLTPRATLTARYGGLTAREREVAVLLAQGKSNREIAEALVLGERTIETHVSHVLGKLALGSRREIARWAVENGLTGQDV